VMMVSMNAGKKTHFYKYHQAPDVNDSEHKYSGC
jgi:hypothetical protein